MNERKLRRKNRMKVVRSIFELAVILAVITWAVVSLITYRNQMSIDQPDAEKNCVMVPCAEIVGDLAPVAVADSPHFIAISYNGLTDTVREGGKLVTKAAYEEQLQALKASGYRTVTQRDLIDFYENGAPLPEKSLFLIFEDGIMDSTRLAYPALQENNYIATACTYAGNLSDEEGHYITAKEMDQLRKTTFWETGSNGYRLSYINVFDRFENFFGCLNTDEFLAVRGYLRRDYNHYLMDFIRDEDRIRTESPAQMEERIAWDYEKSAEIYEKELGYVPALYLLMHSNTGAYGNDPMVSRKNAEMMKSVFALNFNRQGTCLNTRDSSPYDLSRLQSREYFFTNHLMMRIWDDTGHDVVFRLGDEAKAADWERRSGAAEFKGRKIVLTTLPYGKGELCFGRPLPAELELTVQLQGNAVGQQAIKLCADENGEGGIVVRLHDNAVLIEDSSSVEPIFQLDLFRFDGGPFVSEPEEELQGRIALAQAIIEFDKDEARIKEAELALQALNEIQAPGIRDGAEPYIPDLDISRQDSRTLRIRLKDGEIYLWLDDTPVAARLPVAPGAGNRLFLEAEVTRGTERFSQANLSDDVYDGVFNELRITDLDGGELYSYAVPLPGFNGLAPVQQALDRVIEVFRGFYSLGEGKDK